MVQLAKESIKARESFGRHREKPERSSHTVSGLPVIRPKREFLLGLCLGDFPTGIQPKAITQQE
jgi:hypothetical protein